MAPKAKRSAGGEGGSEDAGGGAAKLSKRKRNSALEPPRNWKSTLFFWQGKLEYKYGPSPDKGPELLTWTGAWVGLANYEGQGHQSRAGECELWSTRPCLQALGAVWLVLCHRSDAILLY